MKEIILISLISILFFSTFLSNYMKKKGERKEKVILEKELIKIRTILENLENRYLDNNLKNRVSALLRKISSIMEDSFSTLNDLWPIRNELDKIQKIDSRITKENKKKLLQTDRTAKSRQS